MKAPKRLLLFGFIIFAMETGHSTILVAQKEISVSRTLAGHAYVGGTNVPASEVTVELCSFDWQTVLATTKTDYNGHFSFKEAASGKQFYVRLPAPGMDIYQLRVRIKKRAAPELTIHLSVAT
jgi:hypothetical protein